MFDMVENPSDVYLSTKILTDKREELATINNNPLSNTPDATPKTGSRGSPLKKGHKPAKLLFSEGEGHSDSEPPSTIINSLEDSNEENPEDILTTNTSNATDNTTSEKEAPHAATPALTTMIPHSMLTKSILKDLSEIQKEAVRWSRPMVAGEVWMWGSGKNGKLENLGLTLDPLCMEPGIWVDLKVFSVQSRFVF